MITTWIIFDFAKIGIYELIVSIPSFLWAAWRNKNKLLHKNNPQKNSEEKKKQNGSGLQAYVTRPPPARKKKKHRI